MKYKLPILFFAMLTAWLFLETRNLLPRLSSFARPPAGEQEEKRGKTGKDATEKEPDAVDPQQLVWQAGQNLIKEDVLQADIQQQINTGEFECPDE